MREEMNLNKVVFRFVSISFSILVILLVLIGFAFVINRKMKHATDVPDTLQNIAELIVEKLDGMV